jgi:hypothetical protein
MRAYDPKKAAQHHHEIHAHVPSEPALRVKALESLLVEEGLVDSGAIDAWIEIYRDQVGPKLGARVVARAWNDAAYKARLLGARLTVGERAWLSCAERPALARVAYSRRFFGKPRGAVSRRIRRLFSISARARAKTPCDC